MSEDTDDSQKTEEPSQRRLEEALKKGQIINSKEITNFFMMIALTFIIGFVLPKILRDAISYMSHFLENADEYHLDEKGIGILSRATISKFSGIILFPLMVTIIAAIASSLAQQGSIRFSLETITPKLEKISPIKGLGRIFSKKSLFELLKNLIKTTIIALVAYLAIKSELPALRIAHNKSIAGSIGYLFDLCYQVMIAVCIVMAFMAGLDYFYQRYEYYQNLRMSKQEVKEEYKQTEGNPEVKSKLRSIRMARAKKRMMSNVPTADVIITNPTHFAVALKYDNQTMRAPVVVAKGQDKVALKIREIAKENKIPIYENPPLARILYANVELDNEIPVEHYKAVAEVISYIYKLKNKK